MALEVTNVELEVVALPQFDGKKVEIVFLGLPTRGVPSEKRFGDLIEVVERMQRQGVEPIQGHAFQTRLKY